MKKLVIMTTLASIVSMMNAAQAGDKINFHGEVTESTCSSAVVGGNDVTLPTVSTTAFASQTNSAAGRTQFVIDLTGCTLSTGKTKVAAYFNASSDGAANVDGATGFLNNTNEGATGGAKGVKLQLIDGTTLTPIKVGYADQSAAVGSNGFQVVSAATDGTARLSYFVEYVKTAPLTAGTVEGNVVYDIMYK